MRMGATPRAVLIPNNVSCWHFSDIDADVEPVRFLEGEAGASDPPKATAALACVGNAPTAAPMSQISLDVSRRISDWGKVTA